ncbi:hypothetical protein [Cupriavidus malaysiensis]|uniref:hypothetical protein n=1 Tax=Cupriavidus malaysiensis TaxID=367825 RepID=UPI0012FF79DB|nr:hypothetical protein [Cupriavidus malaysiensis]
MSRLPIKPAARRIARLGHSIGYSIGHAIGNQAASAARPQRLRVYLGHGALAVCRSAGRFHSSVQDKAILSGGTGVSDLPNQLAALESWLEAHPARADIEWIIGIEHVRYLLLPWDPRLASDAFCRSLAGALFAQQGAGGTPFAGYQLRYSPLAFGQPCLAALLTNDVIRELTAFARRRGCRTTRIEPALSVVWNRFRARWKHDTGVLALVEGPRLLRIGFAHGHITSFSLQPCSDTRPPATPEETTWVFPARHPAAPGGDVLVLDGFAPDDDPRLAYALCGV